MEYIAILKIHITKASIIFFVTLFGPLAEFEIGPEFVAARDITSRADSVSRACAAHRPILAHVGLGIPREHHFG